MPKEDDLQSLREENTRLRASAHTAWRYVADLAQAHGQRAVVEEARRRLVALNGREPIQSFPRMMIDRLEGDDLDSLLEGIERREPVT